MGLKGSHVKVGDEVHDSHRSRHKRDLVLLITQELYDLKTRHLTDTYLDSECAGDDVWVGSRCTFRRASIMPQETSASPPAS